MHALSVRRLFPRSALLILCTVLLPLLAPYAHAERLYVRLAPADVRTDASMTVSRIEQLPEVVAMQSAVRAASSPRVAAVMPELLRWRHVDVADGANSDDLIATLTAMSGVEIVERAPIRYTTALPSGSGDDDPTVAGMTNDPMVPFQWHLNAINAFAAWDELDASTEDIVIAVLDNGVDLDHPDLINAIWVNQAEKNGSNNVDDDGNGYIDDINGWDTRDNDGLPEDPTSSGDSGHGHGTHCSGIAAATPDNSIGVVGTSNGARLMHVRIGEGQQIYDTADGVLYAALNGADVISMSFAGTTESVFERDVMAFAQEQGAVLLAAAGNGSPRGTNQQHYPAAYPEVIGVAATNIDNEVAEWSHFGWWVDVAAPGEDIFSTYPGGYGFSRGTSMACPLVAGVVAMLKAQHPELDHAMALALLEQGAQPAQRGWAPNTAVGVVDAWRSVLGDRPVLVLRDVSLSNDTDGDGRLEAAESADMTLSFDLIGPADSYAVSLKGGAFNTDLSVNGSFSDPDVPTGLVTVTAFNVQAGNNPNRGERPIALVSDVGGYQDTVAVRIPLDPPWVTMETAGMVASVADFGAIGYQDYVLDGDDDQADGVRLKDEPRGFLYHGSIMITDNNGGVADNAYGPISGDAYDFYITSAGNWATISDAGDLKRMRSTFIDPIQVGVVVTQTVKANPDGADIVYLDYNVQTNNGVRDLTVGIYCDWDIAAYGNNQVGYNSSLRLSYMSGAAGYAGVVALGNNTITGAAAVSNSTVFSGGFSDAEKRGFLSGGVSNAVSGNPGDWSHLIAQQVEDVGPIGTKLVQFALVAARTQSELFDLAELALGGGSSTQGDGSELTDVALLPTSLALTPAWPNPFNAGTRLGVSLDGTSDVSVSVYDLLGRRVADLYRGSLSTGSHEIAWDGMTSAGDRASAGAYLIRAVGNDLSATRKVVLVK